MGTFVSLALISFVGGIFVDYYVSQHSPRLPEPEAGRIFSVTVNKVEVYVTKYELIAIRVPGISFFIWFGAVLYFGVRWKFMQVAIKEPEYRGRAQVTKKKNGDSSQESIQAKIFYPREFLNDLVDYNEPTSLRFQAHVGSFGLSQALSMYAYCTRVSFALREKVQVQSMWAIAEGPSN